MIECVTLSSVERNTRARDTQTAVSYGIRLQFMQIYRNLIVHKIFSLWRSKSATLYAQRAIQLTLISTDSANLITNKIVNY